MRNRWRRLVAVVLALASCTQAPDADEPTIRSAQTMKGWLVAVGDGLYHPPVEEPVSLDDIRTTHDGSLTTLEANVHGRNVMAHNITYLWLHGAGIDERSQVFETDVRLPYLPVASALAPFNAQTIEAQVGSWNGATGLDAVCAVQWQLNPYTQEFGALALWTPGEDDIGEWRVVDQLPVDTRWQRWVFGIDPGNRQCSYTIAGRTYTETAPLDPKLGWDSRDGVHVGIEIISMYPGTGEAAIHGKPHYAEFRVWTWTIGVGR